jgi:hypothetical protein
VRGCCFVLIFIVLLEAGWLGLADADSSGGQFYHGKGGYTFSVVSNFRGVVRGCCQREADRGGGKMWAFDNVLSYRGHRGLNGVI